MREDRQQKVSASHLKRNAYLYIRQSSLRQVFENSESTERQYALRQQAIALGWPVEQVIVIDTDLGQSGASSVDREAFSDWWPRWVWARPASSSDSRYRDWRATPPIGIGCWKSVP